MDTRKSWSCLLASTELNCSCSFQYMMEIQYHYFAKRIVFFKHTPQLLSSIQDALPARKESIHQLFFLKTSRFNVFECLF